MKHPQDIILKPVITEKSMAGVADKSYTFYVAPDANKTEIKKAVEELFGVKVRKVNTIKLPAKQKRVGVHSGYTTARHKAIVKLTDGSKTIEFFESMV